MLLPAKAAAERNAMARTKATAIVFMVLFPSALSFELEVTLPE
jgi:hypothetical protein